MSWNFKKRSNRWLMVAGLLAGAIVIATAWPVIAQNPVSRFAGPQNSQTLALDAAGTLLVTANPDNNSVTLFEVAADRNRRVQEQGVGVEPRGVGILPNGSRVYVANQVSGTVSVLVVNRPNLGLRWLTDIRVGTEPFGLALTPNGRKLYVTNSRSNDVSVIDTATNRVLKTIPVLHNEPRGVAITNDGDEQDDDETVYVSHFLAFPNPGQLDGEDDAKIGRVSVISAQSDEVTSTTDLQPIRDTGFKAAGDAIARQAPPAQITEESLRFQTGAYPNQLNNLAIKNDFVYVPSTGASPNGPVRFDVNTQSLLTILDRRDGNKDTGATINMHLAVKNQTNSRRLFVTQPMAIAFKNRANEGYVLATASDVMIKVAVNPTSGVPEVLRDPLDNTRVLQVPTGKNPRGIVINSAETRAYVMNYISRDVTVINLTGPAETVLATLRASSLPEQGSFEDLVHAGKELYHASVGEFDPPTPFAQPIRGRMSNNGWGSCSSCHPDGLTDNVVWIFGAGPRRTIPQHADYDPTDASQQRAFNWSGIFDEQEDFENNIRGTSGGLGLIVGPDRVTPDPTLGAFTPANAGRRQLFIRGFGAWDAIKAYLQFGVRAPLSPVRKDEPDVIEGEAIFRQANCQSCHGGPTWTSSRLTHTGVPPADLLSNGQLIRALRKVDSFRAADKNEVRQNAANPLGADGFVPPSLLSISAWRDSFFHNGAVDTLDKVMENVAHRSSGTNGTDTLTDAEQRRKLIRFLLSIDANSTPIPIP